MIALSPKPSALPWLLLAWAAAWGVATAVPLFGGASLTLQLAICLPIVAAFGLPHGATDWWIASNRLPGRLGPTMAPYWPVLFTVVYLFGCLVAVGIIMAAPALALALFLTGTVWHWGDHDARDHGLPHNAAAWITCGLPVITAPMALRPYDTTVLLNGLGVAVAPIEVAIAGGLGLLAAAAAATRLPVWPKRLCVEMAALMVLYAVAPPLPAFTAYFCLMHAPRQVANLPVQGPARSALIVAAAAVVLIGVPLAAASYTGHLAPTRAAIQAVFWGLAVLTLPHVLCGWLLLDAPLTPATHVSEGHPA
jgi:Brp/Blh family beta-carotene 15,15'-monooxygenase